MSEVPPIAAPYASATTSARGELIVISAHASPPGTGGRGAVAYSLDRGRWRALADPPWRRPLLRPAAVSTGESVVVMGMPCVPHVSETDDDIDCEKGRFQAASYDARRNRWREIPIPRPLGAPDNDWIAYPVGWTGTQAVFNVSVGPGLQLWGYAPVTGRWRRIPDAPHGRGQPCAFEGGLASVRLEELEVGERGPTAPRPPSGTVYSDRQNAWSSPVGGESLPPGAFSDPPQAIACAGRTVVLLSHECWGSGFARFDAAERRWMSMTPPPESTGITPTSVWTGRELVVVHSETAGGFKRVFPTARVHLAYDPKSDRWRRLDAPGEGMTRLWSVGERVLASRNGPPQFRELSLAPAASKPPAAADRAAVAKAYWEYWGAHLAFAQKRGPEPDRGAQQAADSVYAAVYEGGPNAVALLTAVADAGANDEDAYALGVGPVKDLLELHGHALQPELTNADQRSPRFHGAYASARKPRGNRDCSD